MCRKSAAIGSEARFTLTILAVIFSLFGLWQYVRGESALLFLVVPVMILAPVLWLVSEIKRWALGVRVMFGVGAMISSAVVVHSLARAGAAYESRYHRAGMEALGALLEEGRNDEVMLAVAEYNRVARNQGNTLAAIGAMNRCLEGHKKPSN